MEGLIHNFRRSRSKQYTRHIIISVEGVDSREKADELKGKKVQWITEKGNKILGEVASAHGNKGRVRAIFERGLPGQSLGTKVEVK